MSILINHTMNKISHMQTFQTLQGHENPVLDFVFSGGTLGSGARDGSFNLWDMQTGSLTSRFQAHKGPITIVDCVRSETEGDLEWGNVFVSAGVDGTVKVWCALSKSN